MVIFDGVVDEVVVWSIVYCDVVNLCNIVLFDVVVGVVL